MRKSKKNKKRPSITDWIQAIAAAISIPAAIFAFYTFFHKDEDLQRQITNLDTISKQSLIQTEILTKQVDILREEQEFLREQNEMTLSHRRIDIEPKLIIEFDNQNGDIVTAFNTPHSLYH